MSIFSKLFKPKPKRREPSPHWQCPKCKALLQKGISPQFLNPNAMMIGIATCGACGAKYQQADVYNGKYDVRV